jgi:hypothetical protein
MMDTATAQQNHPAIIRILAHIVSVVFHPLFITSYVGAFLIYLHPYAFAAALDNRKVFKLGMIVFNTAFIPLFSVFLMWRLRLIESLFLRTSKERIIPYVAAMICYFWTWLVTRNTGDSPSYMVHFMLGTFLAICAAFLVNIYMKVSMHTIAMGGMATFFFLQAFAIEDSTGLYFSIAVLIAGLVGTARMIVSDHKPVEIYVGYLVGIICQLIALAF